MKTINNSSSGECLKALRVELGLSQSELSNIFGLTAGHSIISKYEHDRVKPGVEVCIKYIELAKQHMIEMTLEDIRPDLYHKG